MNEKERDIALRADVQKRIDTTYSRVTEHLQELQAEQMLYYESFDRLVVGQLLMRHRERIDEVNAIRNSAFIRRIEYRDTREAQDVTIYIGAIPYESGGCSIVSWAAPLVGQLLYPPHTSQTFKAQAKKIIELDISHRIIRKFAVTLDGYEPSVQQDAQNKPTAEKAESIHDVPLAGSGADQYLQHILKQKKHENLGVIIQSIQQEQYQIIAAPATKLKIIQGVPGSGKTVIALHRIAYLVFNAYKTSEGEQIAPENVLFIGPNQRFFEHVKNVLPTLGQRDIRSRTPYALLESFRLTGGHQVRSPQDNLDVMLSNTLLDPHAHVFERESLMGTLRMVDYIKNTVDKIIEKEIQVCLATPLHIDIEECEEKSFRTGCFDPSSLDQARKQWEILAKVMAGHVKFKESYLQEIVRRALVNVQGRYVLLASAFRNMLRHDLLIKLQSEQSYKKLITLSRFAKQDELVSDIVNMVHRAVRKYTPALQNSGLQSGILTSKKLLTADDIRATRVNLDSGATEADDVMQSCAAMANFVFRSVLNPEFLFAFSDNQHSRILAKHNGKVETTADLVLLSWIMCYLQKQILVTGYSAYTHVVCDEAQDISPLFFDLLTRIFLRADFTLYGDMNQNILNYGTQTGWNEYLPDVQDADRTLLQLRHTYRSTAEIIRYATAILQKSSQFDGELPIPIVESGNEPQEIQYTGVKELASLLLRMSANHSGQSIAVITKKKTSIEGLRTLIAAEIGSNMRNLEQRCKFVSVAEAKGLEFDVVFLLNADAGTYPCDLLHARLMYVAATRAAKQLYVLYEGERSPLLG